ncbi:MAG: GHKL domain-containing protein, partial [Lachnospiraceae bacterium]|nr:GHKL domain-containing protein [Lachnospiraceae bacterium]
YQNKLLARQIAEVENLYLTMRGWRHDYHNHIQAMLALTDNPAQIREYLLRLNDDLTKVDTVIKTGNVMVDAILNSKLSIAEKEKIRINCKAEIGENLAIEDIDLCVIIGNLIDNAVESCRKMPEDAERFLRIYLCIRKQQLYITVTNSTGEVIRKRDAEYISNKRGDHGHGLKRIDLVVEKYNGYIRRANEPGVFSTEIMLPL